MNEHARHPADLDEDEISALQQLGGYPLILPSACPEPSRLLALDADVLDAAGARRVREHRDRCETCRTLARDLAVVLDGDPTESERLRISARVLAAPPAAMRTWRTVAGAALATAATVGFVLFIGRDVVPPASPAGPSVIAAHPHVPTVFIGSRPDIPRAEPELTVRGQSGSPSLSERIGIALDTADEGRVDDALTQLTALTRTNSRSADAHLALGSVLLRADRLAAAVRALERAKALSANEVAEEFDWYLAAALARSGESARASAMLERLCVSNSIRGALACAGLAELGRRSGGRQ